MFNVQLQVFFGLYKISMIFKYSFYVLLILCNKAFLFILNGLML
jgi:hypothetical protein